MVTINTAKYLLVGLVILIMASLSVAADRLEFKDVEVKVDGEKNDNLEDGDNIGDEAKPGDEINVKVRVESNFSNSDEDDDGDEIEIQNIEVTVTLEGVDDGDDLDESFDLDDLQAGDDDSGSVQFTIPDEVGEGDYDLIINVEGEDTNGTTHEIEMTLSLEVQKERHEIIITRAVLSPEQVRCARNSQLGVTILNTGQEDEDDNTLTISNSELGISFSDTFDVAEGEFDDEMSFSKTYSFSVGKDEDAGTYPIAIRANYDSGDETVSETVNLVVEDCTGAALDEADDSSSQDEDSTSNSGSTTTKPSETTTVIVGPGATSAPTNTAEVIQPSQTQTGGQASSEGSLFDSPSFLVGVVVLEVLIVVIGIAFVAYLMRRS